MSACRCNDIVRLRATVRFLCETHPSRLGLSVSGIVGRRRYLVGNTRIATRRVTLSGVPNEIRSRSRGSMTATRAALMRTN